MANTQKGYLQHVALWPQPLAGGRFRMRALTPADVDACPAVIEAEGINPAHLPGPGLVLDILMTGAGFGVAFEPLVPSPGIPRLTSFGCTAFIRPDWAEAAKNCASQDRLADCMAELSSGAPLLSESECKRGSAGDGLTAMLFGARADKHLTAAGKSDIIHLMTRAILTAHAGFNLREILWWVASPELAVHLANGGGPALAGGSAAGSMPQLFALSRADSERTRGSLFYPLFHSQKPVLLLSDAHRQLLWFALQGYSDDEISDMTGVSLAAVKKRWVSLFDRVADRHPALLPDRTANGVRGPAKRSSLIEYVRMHPEELRSYAA